MKLLLSLLFLFSTFVYSQEEIFTNLISSKNIENSKKITSKLEKSYLSTSYYKQNGFSLNQNLRINLPNGIVLNSELEQSFQYTNGINSYTYKINKDENALLTFSKVDGIINGMYQSSNNNKYIIQQTSEDIFAVSEINEQVYIDAEKVDDQVLSEDFSKNTLANSDICAATTPECSGKVVIDLMVLYTTAAKDAWGGESKTKANIATAITNFNKSFIDSGISNVTVNLAYAGEVKYTERTMSDDLSSLRGTSDGVMDNIHSLRNQYAADLVCLVIAGDDSACGLGQLNTNATNYSANNAFCVAKYSCAVGNFSLAHEFGHNMGLRHDWLVDGSSTPCKNHHAYANKKALDAGNSSTTAQRWRTIMAYNNACQDKGFSCTRVNRWSNPDVTYNGDPTGIAINQSNPSNEAFGFKRFACVVSKFRSPTLSAVEFEKVQFSVLPNPTKGTVTIDTAFSLSKVSVYNTFGQLLLSTNEKTIDMTSLNAGVYLLNIYSDNGSLAGVRKIVKE
jgi:peptidyl-Asp metalloendopeptidase